MTTEVSPGWYRCPGCNSHMGAEGFHKSKRGPHGLQSVCKQCNKVKNRQHRLGRPKTANAQVRIIRYFTHHDK